MCCSEVVIRCWNYIHCRRNKDRAVESKKVRACMQFFREKVKNSKNNAKKCLKRAKHLNIWAKMYKL